MSPVRKEEGFSLLENLVALALFSLTMIIMLTSLYIISSIKSKIINKIDNYCSFQELKYRIQIFIDNSSSVISCNVNDLACQYDLSSGIKRNLLNTSIVIRNNIVCALGSKVKIGELVSLDARHARYITVSKNKHRNFNSKDKVIIRDGSGTESLNEVVAVSGERLLLLSAIVPGTVQPGSSIYLNTDLCLFTGHNGDNKINLFILEEDASPAALDENVTSFNYKSTFKQLTVSFSDGHSYSSNL